MSLSIIIVNWNSKPYVLRCLGALRESGLLEHEEVILVDNASHDGTVDAVRQSFPGVHIVANGTNRGFAGGVNDGFLSSTGTHVLVLNPDILLRRGQVEPLLDYLERHPAVGAVLPLLLDDEGRPQRGYIRRLPSLPEVLLFETELRRWSMSSQSLVQRYLEFPVGSESTDVEQIPGAFLLTSREVLTNTHGLDESFRLFYEDVDWSVRVRSAGYRLVVLPSVAVTHSGGKSFTQDHSARLTAQYLASLIHYFALHRGRGAACLAAMILVLHALTMVIARAVARPFLSRAAASTLNSIALRQRAFLEYLFARYVRRRTVNLLP